MRFCVRTARTRTLNNSCTAFLIWSLVAQGLTSNEYALWCSLVDWCVPFSVTSGRSTIWCGSSCGPRAGFFGGAGFLAAGLAAGLPGVFAVVAMSHPHGFRTPLRSVAKQSRLGLSQLVERGPRQHEALGLEHAVRVEVGRRR